jgi:hypothetical protein
VDSGFGYSALNHNTTGGNNTAIGALALVSNTTGNGNTGIGVQVITENQEGSYNTATGNMRIKGTGRANPEGERASGCPENGTRSHRSTNQQNYTYNLSSFWGQAAFTIVGPPSSSIGALYSHFLSGEDAPCSASDVCADTNSEPNARSRIATHAATRNFAKPFIVGGYERIGPLSQDLLLFRLTRLRL